MKVKVNLDKGETLAQAEEKLEKALKAKKECIKGEQYCDPALNEFHEYVEAQHTDLIQNILSEIKQEIIKDLNSKG